MKSLRNFQRGDGARATRARDIAREVCASAWKILNCALRARDVEYMRARKISKKALVNATVVFDGSEEFLTSQRVKNTSIKVFYQNVYKVELRNCTDYQNVENYVIL